MQDLRLPAIVLAGFLLTNAHRADGDTLVLDASTPANADACKKIEDKSGMKLFVVPPDPARPERFLILRGRIVDHVPGAPGGGMKPQLIVEVWWSPDGQRHRFGKDRAEVSLDVIRT